MQQVYHRGCTNEHDQAYFELIKFVRQKMSSSHHQRARSSTKCQNWSSPPHDGDQKGTEHDTCTTSDELSRQDLKRRCLGVFRLHQPRQAPIGPHRIQDKNLYQINTYLGNPNSKAAWKSDTANFGHIATPHQSHFHQIGKFILRDFRNLHQSSFYPAFSHHEPFPTNKQEYARNRLFHQPSLPRFGFWTSFRPDSVINFPTRFLPLLLILDSLRPRKWTATLYFWSGTLYSDGFRGKQGQVCHFKWKLGFYASLQNDLANTTLKTENY